MVIFSVLATTSVATLAHNKVVVVPLGADVATNTGLNQGDIVGYIIVRDTAITHSWMASGETPTMTVPSAGRFEITWPGENFSIIGANAMSAQATLYVGSPSFIGIDSNSGESVVKTWDSAGNSANPFGFTVTLFQNNN